MYGNDPAPRREPFTTAQWWFTGLFLAGFLGLFIADICHNYTPIKLSALHGLLFWIPLLALHEAGHALVAWLVGWHVTHIVIGMGNKLTTFRLGSAHIELRMFPIEGFVRCLPTNLTLPGLKDALIYLVGPDRLFTPSENYSDILWQSLALAAASQGIMNLIPLSTTTQQGNLRNDGLGFLQSLFRPTSAYAEMLKP